MKPEGIHVTLIWMILFVVVCTVVCVTVRDTCYIQESRQWGGKEVDCSHKQVSLPIPINGNVTSLIMRSTGLTDIHKHDLQLPNLRHLDLRFNLLTKLEPNSFDDLKLLEWLDLGQNNLNYTEHSLPVELFQGLERLRILKLEQSIAERTPYTLPTKPYYPDHIFQFTPELEEINLGCFQVVLAPIPRSLAGIRSLHTIRIGSSRLKKINVESLASLRNSSVRTLIFNGCHLKDIEAGTFANIPHLTALRLPSVHPKAVETSFRYLGTTPLTTLIIDADQFHKLTTSLFCNDLRFKMRRLAIQNYNSRLINFEVLNCLRHLTELSVNYITVFDVVDGNGQKYVTMNDISEMCLALPNTLQVLEVSNIHIFGNNYELAHDKCLKDNIGPCNPNIEDFFPTLPAVETDTEIFHHTVPSPNYIRFKLPKLVKFLVAKHITAPCSKIIGVNNLPHIKGIMADQNSVEAIDLSYASFLSCFGRSDYPNHSILGLTHLQYVDISHIGLRSFPNVKGLDRLRVLNISHNRLGETQGKFDWSLADESFWNVTSLEILDLSYNHLTSIPSNMLMSHPKLNYLNLAHNRLRSFDVNINLPLKLNLLLNISNNTLPFLPNAFLQGLEYITDAHVILDVTRNPFLCVCALRNMAEWLQRTRIKVTSKKSLQCYTTTGVAKDYQDIYTVNSDSLCPSVNVILITGITIAATLLTCGIMLGIGIKYKLVIRVHYHLIKWKIRRIFGQSIESNIDKYLVYIVYNDKCYSDSVFVTRTLREMVEEEWGKRAFIWDRDASVGHSMPDEIVNAMKTCHKLMIVLSPGLFYSDKHPHIYRKVDGDVAELNTNDMQEMTVSTGEEPPIHETTPVFEDWEKGEYNEWMDFSLLTVMQLMRDKDVCVIHIGQVKAKSVCSKWHPILFPNIHLSRIRVVKNSSQRFSLKLHDFVMD